MHESKMRVTQRTTAYGTGLQLRTCRYSECMNTIQIMSQLQMRIALLARV